jgi:hypothetical protein
LERGLVPRHHLTLARRQSGQGIAQGIHYLPALLRRKRLGEFLGRPAPKRLNLRHQPRELVLSLGFLGITHPGYMGTTGGLFESRIGNFRGLRSCCLTLGLHSGVPNGLRCQFLARPAAIQDLQIQLVHERLARGEAIERADGKGRLPRLHVKRHFLIEKLACLCFDTRAPDQQRHPGAEPFVETN